MYIMNTWLNEYESWTVITCETIGHEYVWKIGVIHW
jgi:hypothetical protein